MEEIKKLTEQEKSVLQMANVVKKSVELGIGQITDRLGANEAQHVLPSAIGVVGLANDYIKKSRELTTLKAELEQSKEKVVEKDNKAASKN